MSNRSWSSFFIPKHQPKTSPTNKCVDPTIFTSIVAAKILSKVTKIYPKLNYM